MRAGRVTRNRGAVSASHAAFRRRVFTHPGRVTFSTFGSGARGIPEYGGAGDAPASCPDQPAGNRRADTRCANPHAHGSRQAHANSWRGGSAHTNGYGIARAHRDT